MEVARQIRSGMNDSVSRVVIFKRPFRRDLDSEIVDLNSGMDYRDRRGDDHISKVCRMYFTELVETQGYGVSEAREYVRENIRGHWSSRLVQLEQGEPNYESSKNDLLREAMGLEQDFSSRTYVIRD